MIHESNVTNMPFLRTRSGTTREWGNKTLNVKRKGYDKFSHAESIIKHFMKEAGELERAR